MRIGLAARRQGGARGTGCATVERVLGVCAQRSYPRAMESCPFCQIARDQTVARVVFATDDVIAFHDIAPRAPVHILIIPRRHITSLALSTPEDRELLGTLMLAAAEAARRAGIAESGFRVVINAGRGAGQTVPHLHLHVLGGRLMPWPPG
jgi:histidine triad (HIT) family protein